MATKKAPAPKGGKNDKGGKKESGGKARQACLAGAFRLFARLFTEGGLTRNANGSGNPRPPR